MNNSIKATGIIANGLLLAALAMSLLHIPNHALLILAAILIMITAGSALLLKQLNREYPQSRVYNLVLFMAAIIFVPALFFALQQIFLPVKIAVILAVITGILLISYIVREVLIRRSTLKRVSFLPFYLLFILLLVINLPIILQAPDFSYRPEITSPAYPKGEGPLILFDEAHNNIHSLRDRFLVTARLMEDDGYNVQPLNEKITSKEVLAGCRILIICNALHDRNVSDWTNPTWSAFSEKEIRNISQWVFEGGSLLLIVNHMPIPGAAYDLAWEFGFELRNGHARQIPRKDNIFYRAGNTLTDNPITNGMDDSDAVDSIIVFDGSAFLIPADATSILTLGPTFYQWDPDRVWDFDSVEPYHAEGYSIGAFKTFGKGKVVVYGDAMMFTAQLGAGLSWIRIGMNSAKAPYNYRLLLNTIRWLDNNVSGH